MRSKQRLWAQAGVAAGLAAVVTALVLSGCASPSAAPTAVPGVAPGAPAASAQQGAAETGAGAGALHKQYQCATGERIGLSYIGQAGQPGERAILTYAGQRLAMQRLPHAAGQYVAEDAENSYRWSEPQGALRFKAAGASAQEVDVLTQCREVAPRPGRADPGTPDARR